jgi:hypothetical protein
MKNTVTKSKSQWRKNEMNYLTKQQIFGMYLGQKCFENDILKGILIAVIKGFGDQLDTCYIWSDNKKLHPNQRRIISAIDDCKLILRSYSEMSKEEKTEEEELQSFWDEYGYSDSIESINYLISIGIDVFDCHSKGWVVYESELQKGD